MPSFQPSDKLWTRTFIGLLAAQFLAAFNDQAIHASAMFFAIKTNTLSEAYAIALMPILFYAPWAIFGTLAGWLADRYGKSASLFWWKVIEVFITVVALAGFWMGRSGYVAGPWVVLATVFGMGLHSTFFVPAKYGAMPEILQAHLLSRGNGVLESLSFLAVIFGTVTGGVLSYFCAGQEYVIGLLVVGLAVLGVLASLLIQRIPAADPGRPFPPYVYKPLVENVGRMLRSRPMVLSVIGIAFFTFLVAFMRSTVYMYGECQVPRWNELDTSAVVGMVALGIGVGSPLVGYLSGGKVEVGLVPIGSIGMALAAGAGAFLLNRVPGLIACIVLIGLFTGFYLVPLYSLLQNRAPKSSKGDWIATSNFLNVVGAMIAAGVFYLMFQAAIHTGLAPELPLQDVQRGTLTRVDLDEHDRPLAVEIDGERIPEQGATALVDPVWTGIKPGEAVAVASYTLGGTTHYRLRPASEAAKPVYDKRELPSLLFLSVAAMTLLTFFLLRSQLPDLFLRTLLWFRRQGRHGLEVDGMENLPTEGPVLLATNADNLDACLSVLSATDRTTRFVLVQAAGDRKLSWFARRLAGRDMLAVMREAKHVDWEAVARKAEAALAAKEVVGLPVGADYPPGWLDRMFEAAGRRSAPVLPVHVEAREKSHGKGRRIYLLGGEPLKPGATLAEARRAVETLTGGLAEQEQEKKDAGAIAPAHQIVGVQGREEPPSSLRQG